MNVEATKRAAAVMLEFCRISEADPDGRGVRWRLVYRGTEINYEPEWYSPKEYGIETRKPETVFRVEYTKGRIDLLAAEFRTHEAANASSCDGECGTITEIERTGEWVTWEPAETESKGHSEGRTLRDLVYEWGVVHHGFRNASDGVHGTIRDNILHAISVEVVREFEKRAAEDRERREQQAVSAETASQSIDEIGRNASEVAAVSDRSGGKNAMPKTVAET